VSPDAFDDYQGEFDDLAAEETEARAERARQALAATSKGIEVDEHGRWTGQGRAPVRPWWCASCLAPAITEGDKQYGLCAGCSHRERARRERAREEREASEPRPTGVRRRAA
jgi:hypothetical protein